MAYKWSEIGNRNPIQISGAIMGVVNLPIIGQLWKPDPAFVSGLNIALVGLLGLFVVAKTTNKAALAEVDATVSEVADSERAAGFDDAVVLATVIEEQVTGKVAETLEAVAQLTVPPPAPAKRAAAKKKPAVKKRA